MRFSPILLVHICAGTLGVLSGAVAVCFRKGSRWHALAGTVFVISMLTLGASGAYMATMKWQPGNILGAYLRSIWWQQHRDAGTGIFNWIGLLIVSALTGVELTLGLEAAMSPTGTKYGYPPGPYFFIEFRGFDRCHRNVRMLVRSGISGTQRIARHLWRICFAFFIAAASIFLARQHLFPALLRKTGVLFLLSFFPLILMIFWLVRVRLTDAFKGKRMLHEGVVYSLQAQPSSLVHPAGNASRTPECFSGEGALRNV